MGRVGGSFFTNSLKTHPTRRSLIRSLWIEKLSTKGELGIGTIGNDLSSGGVVATCLSSMVSFVFLC
jgi:hypothetical protein